MNYDEATAWLFAQLPMYQRQGAAAYKANLDGTWKILERFDRPDLKLNRVVHVAGTNGKGSVSTAIANALIDQGKTVGLFTSPHLVDYRERMRVNGRMPAREWVAEFIAAHRSQFSELDFQPSFFEWTFGMALAWFAEERVDFVVLETGMGGRLDSTNVFPTPCLTVITNVGLDHQQFLGNDIRSIAREKAGIIKEGVPVVMGRMRPEAQSVVLETANRMGAEVHYAEASVSHAREAEGPHWPENRATAHKALEVLSATPCGKGIQVPPCQSLQKTGHAGRWQWLSFPECLGRVLIDCAHNQDGLERTLEGIAGMKFEKLHVVFGTVSDKELTGTFALLPKSSAYYFCAADIPRALPSEELQSQAQIHGLNGTSHGRVKAAFAEACETAGPDDLVVVLGSIFIAAEVLELQN